MKDTDLAGVAMWVAIGVIGCAMAWCEAEGVKHREKTKRMEMEVER